MMEFDAYFLFNISYFSHFPCRPKHGNCFVLRISADGLSFSSSIRRLKADGKGYRFDDRILPLALSPSSHHHPLASSPASSDFLISYSIFLIFLFSSFPYFVQKMVFPLKNIVPRTGFRFRESDFPKSDIPTRLGKSGSLLLLRSCAFLFHF
jgi:hypothetical protein